MRKQLAEAICPDGVLYDLGWFVEYSPGIDDICLDGHFDVKTLEAIVMWMRTHNGMAKEPVSRRLVHE